MKAIGYFHTQAFGTLFVLYFCNRYAPYSAARITLNHNILRWSGIWHTRTLLVYSSWWHFNNFEAIGKLYIVICTYSYFVAGLFALSLTSTGKPQCSTVLTQRSWMSVNRNGLLYYFIWNIYVGVSVTNVYYFQSHTTRCITVVFYMATSFGPECGLSAGHYTRTRKYTETLCVPQGSWSISFTLKYIIYVYCISRSQWPWGLRRRFAAACGFESHRWHGCL
jgi:hypothetical protein